MKTKQEITPLDFEKPLIALSKQISELEEKTLKTSNSKVIDDLKNQYEKIKGQIYKNLSPIERIKIARHPQRPYALDYIQAISPTWYELHGDRTGKDDGAIVGGPIEIDGQTVMAIGTQKGRNIK